MKSWSKEDKLVLISSLVMFSCLTIGSLSYFVFGNRIIESIYRGESLDFLNRLVEHHRMSRPWGTLEHYFTLGGLVFSKIFFICVATQLLVVAGLKHRLILSTFKNFFTAATHPINLGVFRVVLFYTIFQSVDISSIVWFSQIPTELRVVPPGMIWLMDHLPINETWAAACSVLVAVFSFAAMIGLFSRTSALFTAVLGVYVLGIPQFYGKVDHYHHLLWFAAILATSPCGEALSCDAIIASWRRADRGLTAPPGPAQAYALPLRFVWLLMGVMYFFAGFWKFWGAGFYWALSDNLKLIMYEKWSELGNWTPMFRIDRYPLLYKSAAMGTILFEMSFVFLIFSKKVRFLAPLAGLLFHTMTEIFMRISFASLVKCYVAFFDWNAIFRRIGGMLYREQMYVIYDGNCKLCRRTVASLRVFDLFGRVTYLNALDQEAIRQHRLDWLDSTALMKEMHATVGKRRWLGFAAYRALAARIPLLWPALPFLYLWPIAAVGGRIYRRVADSRTCTVARPPSQPSVASKPEAARAGVIIVGGFLVFASLFLGASDIYDAWPLAAYPSFAGTPGTKTNSLEITVLSSAGEIIPLNSKGHSVGRELPPTRFWGLVGQVLSAKTDEQRRIRLQALWRLWARSDSRLQQADSIRFYRVTLWTVPERRGENPVQRELVFEAKL